MSAAARQGVKDQLGKWKKDQEEKKMSDIQASMQHKTRIDNSAKRKRDRDREGTKEQIEYSASTFFDIAEKYDNAFGFDGHIDGTVGVGKITFAESVLQDEIHYILTSGKYDKRALLQIRQENKNDTFRKSNIRNR